jgi:hypothetical protein
MDVMAAFPRSLFSESEMEVTRWFAGRLGASRLPSVQEVKNHRHTVLEVAGASPTLFEGKLGHVYSMLDLNTILQHVSPSYSLDNIWYMLISAQSYRNLLIP